MCVCGLYQLYGNWMQLVCGGIMAFARDQMPLPKLDPIIFTAPLMWNCGSYNYRTPPNTEDVSVRLRGFHCFHVRSALSCHHLHVIISSWKSKLVRGMALWDSETGHGTVAKKCPKISTKSIFTSEYISTNLHSIRICLLFNAMIL